MSKQGRSQACKMSPEQQCPCLLGLLIHASTFSASSAPGSLEWERAKRLAVAFHLLKAVELITPCSVMPCSSISSAEAHALFRLAVNSDFCTASVHITFCQPCQLCTGSPQSVTFFHAEYL